MAVARETSPVPSFELGPIRPPSEAYSLLIRVARNCPWNRCRFCSLYKGERFSLRPVAEITREITAARRIRDGIAATATGDGDAAVREAARRCLVNPPDAAVFNVALWLYAGGENVFLQDSNALIMKTADLVAVISFLKQTFPGIKRITSYARSHTVNRKTPEELAALHQAGLSRLHVGLESGYDPVLEYMEKGATAAEHIAAGKKVVASGISLSEYVILGLGGKRWWREHALATAGVLSEINPDFIRLRTLAVKPGMPLYEAVADGSFVRAGDEAIITEERLFIEHLDCRSHLVSDHITNLLQEIEGELPRDRAAMLATIDRFQSLPPEERDHFRVGRRLGIYDRLDDLRDAHRRELVARALPGFRRDDGSLDESRVLALMEGFI
ncbi:MAG: radical SAM protein [Chloroflexota bacterium]